MNQQHGLSNVNPVMAMQQPSPQPQQANQPSVAGQLANAPGPNVAVGVAGVQQPTGQPSQQQQSQMSQQQQAERIDNISKVKSLAIPLRESLANTLKVAAQCLQHNSASDNGTTKTVDNNNPSPRFDKHLEEFYSICDQIELHLKTSIQCMQQSSASQRYLPVPVLSTRVEPLPTGDNGPISYPQYLSTVRTQIGYTKDLHDTLIHAAQNISPSE